MFLSQFAIVCPVVKNVDQNMLTHKTNQKYFFFSSPKYQI